MNNKTFTVPMSGTYTVSGSGLSANTITIPAGTTITTTGIDPGQILTYSGTGVAPTWVTSNSSYNHYDFNIEYSGGKYHTHGSFTGSYDTLDELLTVIRKEFMEALNVTETKIKEEVDEFVK